MKKEVEAIFILEEKEIREAFYDYYVRILKSNNINALFSENDINFEISEVTLKIFENTEL